MVGSIKPLPTGKEDLESIQTDIHQDLKGYISNFVFILQV